MVNLRILRDGQRALLVIDNAATIELKDFSINSTLSGGTELKLIIETKDSIMEFSTSAS